MRTITCSAMLSIILLLQGCGCMSQVTVTNDTDAQLLVDVSLPDPGYGMFREHCQFTILMEPGETWDSQATARQERVELPTGPHTSLLLRLVNLDLDGWPNLVYSIGVEESGAITISGTWDNLRVVALNRDGDELDVWMDDPGRWFPQRRMPMEEDDPLLEPR
jgi:hypothetical protein